MANSTKISEYSTTASNNTSIDSIDIDENCAASGINNAIRSVLKHQADAFTQGTPIALDQTNNRVGIGTTSPGGSLEVYKAGTSEVLIGTDNGGTAQLSLYENDDGTKEGLLKYDGTNNRIHLATSGAPNALVIPRDSGAVGIGTDAPTTYGDSNTKLAVVTPTSNANDVNIRFGTNDVKGIIFVNDVSGDGVGFGTTTNDHVQFNTNNTERMRITSGGDLLHGTTSAEGVGYTLQYNGGAPRSFFNKSFSGTGTAIYFMHNGGVVGSITYSNTATAYLTSSDHRLKENVADMTGAIDRVKALAPKRFNFIADADTTVDGFLAHEAQAVVPEAVTGEHNEVDEDGNAVYQGIDQSKLVPLLTGALQEAIAKIEALEARVTALEA